MGGFDTDKRNEQALAYAVETFTPEGLAETVQSGIRHRLNNALTAMAYLGLIENKKTDDLLEIVMAARKPAAIENKNTVEIASGAVAGNKESLIETARKSCRVYIDRFAAEVRAKGIEGETSEEVVEQWQEYVGKQFGEIRAEIGDYQGLVTLAEESWRGVVGVIDDIAGVAVGTADLPPICKYTGGEGFFVDFGRKGPV